MLRVLGQLRRHPPLQRPPDATVRLVCHCGDVVEMKADGLTVVANEADTRLDYRCPACGAKSGRTLDTRMAAALGATGARLALEPSRQPGTDPESR